MLVIALDPKNFENCSGNVTPKKEGRKTNELVRIATYKEAVEYFGDIDDLDFSISQAIKAFFAL